MPGLYEKQKLLPSRTHLHSLGEVYPLCALTNLRVLGRIDSCLQGNLFSHVHPSSISCMMDFGHFDVKLSKHNMGVEERSPPFSLFVHLLYPWYIVVAQLNL